MKRFKNFFAGLFALVLTAGLVLNFGGCTKKSPLTPEVNRTSSQSELHFISLGQKSPSLSKITKVLMETTENVTYKDGGELIIDYQGDEDEDEDADGDVLVKTTFRVFSETISQNARLVLRMTDALLSGEVDVSFQPHGITFSLPGLLNSEAKNIDLLGVNPNNIGIYYVNEDTGEWEKMQTYDIIVKKNEGYLKIINAEIPHFSRYAVAWSN